jgi:hypothetical protein
MTAVLCTSRKCSSDSCHEMRRMLEILNVRFYEFSAKRRPLSEPRDGVENLLSRLAPDKRFRAGMMRVDKFAKGSLQLGHTSLDTAPERLVRQLGEPAFNQIQSRSVRRCEVDVKAARLANQFRISGVMCVA